MGSLTDDELQKLFTWVDTIPLSRAKRNINRDFSDGVLAAEVVAHYFPRLVDMHNYPASSNSAQKLANWRTLNTKVLKKLKHAQAPVMLEDLVHAKQGAAEVFLHSLQYKLARYKAEKSSSSSSSNNNSNSSISHADDDTHQLPSGGRLSPLMASSLEGRFAAAAAAAASSSSPSSPASPSSLARRPGGAHIHSSFASMQSPIPSSSLFSDVSGMDVLRQQQQQASGPMGSVRSPGRGLRQEEQVSVDEEILLEKEETLQEMRETVDILELKMAKLEQLLRLKDVKIQTLSYEVARLTIVANSSSSSSSSSKMGGMGGVVTGGGSLLLGGGGGGGVGGNSSSSSTYSGAFREMQIGSPTLGGGGGGGV